MFRILLFPDLAEFYPFALQKRCSRVLPLLVRCFFPVAIGWPRGLRGRRRSRFEAAGWPAIGVCHGMAALGYRRTPEQPHVLLREERHRREMFEAMREQPTFAERDVDVGRGSTCEN